MTGYVDGALEPSETAVIEAHLAGCEACRTQVDEERELRGRLRSLAAVDVPPALPFVVRRRLGARRFRWTRVLLPVAAGLALFTLWLRGAAPFVAWELSLDHAHCFGKDRLPAKVWGSDPGVVGRWFEEQGTELPYLPEGVSGLMLLGGRRCPLTDRQVAHVYYGAEDRTLSFFVVPGPTRFEGARRSVVLGRTVHLMRLEGKVVALVSEDKEAVDAFERALTTTVARIAAPVRLAAR